MSAGKAQQVTNVGLYVLPIVIGNLVPIITLPLFTRLLSKEDFGAQALGTAYAVTVCGISGLGLATAHDRNYFACREGRQPAELFYSVLAFTTAAFLICGWLTWVFQVPITERLIGVPGYERLVVWSFWSSAIVAIKAFYMTHLRNSEKAGAFSAYTIAERLLAAVFTVVLVAGMGAGVIGLVAGQLLASLVVLVVLAVRFLPVLKPAFNARLLGDALKLGYPLVPKIAIGVIGSNFDKYLIGQLSSLGGVGIYSVGQRVAGIAFTYMGALQNVFGPRVYAKMFSPDPNEGRSIGPYLTPFAYVSTLLAFLIAVFSEEILMVLAPSFEDAVPIVTIISVFYGIQFFGKLPQMTFAGKTYLVALIGSVATVLGIAFVAAGIRLLGTIGAAWGALAGGAVAMILMFVYGQRSYRIDWERRKMVAIFGLFLACAMLTIALRTFDVPYSIRITAKVASLAAFAALGAKLRVITTANMALARDIVMRRRSPH